MDTSQPDATTRVQDMQRTWYGEPLGVLFRRLMETLGLNQARLAGVLGLSAPMLSQLMSGQRAKIGNPAVVQRLQALQELASEVSAGAVTAADAVPRMDEIRGSAGSPLLGTTQSATGTPLPPARQVVHEVRALLHTAASPAEIADAADSLAHRHPQLAEFLRVYGAGPSDAAVRDYEARKRGADAHHG
ncbi:helix-turn-helix transcriptional regulator [Actinacidiphila glaucinigra]|uniref:helix-turn-helix domain-containing protein n=1 Tax=Actinacidiphila glaucinigra TaxID=235986 RepID=UPI002E2F7EAD|nr:helix-turn-helix transcriptional regulator [Actinacidiphila glaucinigra]